VTSHNYGRFLGQCLDSILSQTTSFAEVVVVDDASTDDTAEVTAAFRRAGVRYARVEARNSCVARNEGMALTTSPLLANVDADNWLGPRWLEVLLEPMTLDREVAIAHSPPFQVREDGAVIRRAPYARPYDHRALRQRNFIDTCSLVRRDAVEQAGGWSRAACARLDDWHLWLRMTGLGWRAVVLEEPTWYYRLHGGQKSAIEGRDSLADAANVMIETFHVAVVTPFCGRYRCLDRVTRSYERLGWDPGRLHGLFVDNSLDGRFGALLRKALQRSCRDWASVTIVNDATRCRPEATNAAVSDRAELRHTRHMVEAMSRLYAGTIQRLLGPRADLVLTIEDDVEPLGQDLLPRLIAHLAPDVVAVSAVVRSRFEQSGSAPAVIAYDVDSEAPYRHHPLPDDPRASGSRAVGGTGLGCLLARAEAWHEHMPRRVSVNDDGEAAWHDVTWAADVRRHSGLRWLLDWDVRTRHWQEGGTWV
jgi:glycosyltransferase involved in cell wall biosynthesis